MRMAKTMKDQPIDIAAHVWQVLQGLGLVDKVLDFQVVPNQIGNSLKDYVQNENNQKKLFRKLFPAGLSSGQQFFQVFNELSRHAGFNEEAHEAMGKLWSVAIFESNELQDELLTEFIDEQSFYFFINLEYLYVVIKQQEFTSEFLTDWFCRLYDAVRNDGAQDGFWNAIRECCEVHTVVTLEFAEQMRKRPISYGAISSFVIGYIRKSDKVQENPKFKELELFYFEHEDLEYQRIYFNSWLTTVRYCEFNAFEINNVVCVPKERRSCLHVELAAKLIAFTETEFELLADCEKFLLENSSSYPSTVGEWVIPMVAAKMLQRPEPDFTSACELIKLNGLPETTSGRGALVRFLAVVLTRKKILFEELFEFLLQESPVEFKNLLIADSHGVLIQLLRKSKMSSLVSRLCVSRSPASRELGVFLFAELGIEEFDSKAFGVSASSPMILFYEVQLIPFGANVVARLLTAIARNRVTQDSDFDKELRQELLLQCRNYAGEGRREFERIGKDIPVVEQVLKEIEEYFECWNVALTSGVNSMELRGFKKAAAVQKKRFSRQVKKAANKHSTLMQLVKQVQLLYGRTYSQYMNGELSAPSPLSESSVSVESPIVEFVDPEYMALRRLTAKNKLRQLELSRIESKGKK